MSSWSQDIESQPLAVRPRVQHIVLASLAATAIVGCAVGPEYRRPNDDLHPFHASIPPVAANAIGGEEGLGTWWTGFNDPVLAQVVERAREHNLSLSAALARVQGARAVENHAGAAQLPVSGFESQAARIHQSLQSAMGQIGSHLPGFDRNQTLYDVGVSASWEIDLFGGLRRARQAAGAEYQAAEAAHAGTRITVTADTAAAYLTIRGIQARRRLVTRQIDVSAQMLSLTLERFRSGVANVREVAAAETQLAQLKASIEPFDIELEIQSNRLDVLIGQQPGTAADALREPADIPRVPPIPGPGTPTEVLRRRPDVVAAERTLAAAHARIGQALSEYYPKVSIGALVGAESMSTSGLFTSATFQPEAVAGLRWRLFDFGRVGAEVSLARAEHAEALAEYRNSILHAAEDVEDAFTVLAKLQVVQTQMEATVAALDRSLRAAKDSRLVGAESQLTVLDAERQLYVAQEALALARQNSCLAAVGTFRAIGGGW
jgi:NodT family efflux transporter outer membrane factor (OMF) lipoprotein